MIHRNFKTEPINENPHQVDVRKLYDADSAQIMHITLQPGESLKPHKTPVDVCFYIVEGQPTVHIDSESISFPPDTLVESPANIVHYLSNESDGIARIIVVKAPRPQQKTRLL